MFEFSQHICEILCCLSKEIKSKAALVEDLFRV